MTGENSMIRSPDFINSPLFVDKSKLSPGSDNEYYTSRKQVTPLNEAKNKVEERPFSPDSPSRSRYRSVEIEDSSVSEGKQSELDCVFDAREIDNQEVVSFNDLQKTI